MSVMEEERAPFTLPLTPLERSIVQDKVLRAQGVHLVKPRKGEFDAAQEVEEALTVFREMQPWAVERLNREVAA